MKVLVTSRRPLQVRGERTIDLDPLELPRSDEDALAADVASIASVVLFCERASAVNSQFVPTQTSLKSIAEICRLLDGLPLAIELAFAYIKVLPPEALLTRLKNDASERRFELLDRGTADAPAHHRGMRATIGWSHNLLDEAGRRLLRRVAVFDGGWSLEAMESVCAELPDDSLLDALADLVDLHLVEPTAAVEGTPRYRLLETVRRFALERLDEAGEAATVAGRHTEYFVAFALAGGTGLQSRDETRWARWVEADLPNTRAALNRLDVEGRFVDGLRASANLGPFWLDRGPVWEGRRFRSVPRCRGQRTAYGRRRRHRMVGALGARTRRHRDDPRHWRGSDPAGRAGGGSARRGR